MNQALASVSVPPVRDADGQLAGLAKALAHPARIGIVRMLLERETCVGCDVVEHIGLAQSTVSQHLQILKAAGIIIGEIERPRVCYSLNPLAVAPLKALVDAISTHTTASSR
ncbi:MAG: transcriptional regulator [Kaistia sp. SCN 65-12]|mgnify:CR=1 FL=1|nr:MAG: transcriptional regulator [Kaistia sp. SCN 65-12]